MRTGAAGRIATASRPMCRISRRRRFANSSARIGPCSRELVEGELGTRAHELGQLREIALRGIVIATLTEPGPRDLCEVAQELGDVAGPRDRLLGRPGADAIKEA